MTFRKSQKNILKFEAHFATGYGTGTGLSTGTWTGLSTGTWTWTGFSTTTGTGLSTGYGTGTGLSTTFVTGGECTVIYGKNVQFTKR